jgi:hypothetical protein
MSYIDSATTRIVEVRAAWSDPWAPVAKLWPVIGTQSTAPGIGQMEFEYEYGLIKQNDALSFQQFDPLAIDDYWIRIVCQYGAGLPWEEPPFVPWLGRVTDSELDVIAGDVGSGTAGTQRIIAREIAHEWDKVFLTRAKARRDSVPVDIDYLPSFNRRREIGTGVFGNRAVSKLSGESYFRFDDRRSATQSEVWLARDVVEYILANYYPAAFTAISIADPDDALNQYEDVWDLEGRSAWEALNIVIDRRRGCSFYFDVDGTGTVILRVFTTTPTLINVGSGIIPANSNQGPFILPGGFPDKHILENLILRTTTRAAYNRVFVRGERIRVLGTFTAGENGQLIRGWTQAAEDSYADPGGADAAEKDLRRSREKHDAVFHRWIVKRTWNGSTRSADETDPAPLLYRVLANGSMDFNNVGDFWLGSKRFLRDTFLRRDWDYTVDPPTDESPTDSNIDYLPLIVLIKDTFADAVEHEPTEKWIHLEKVSHAIEGIASGVQITPLDQQLGVAIEMNPRHLLAGADFDGDTDQAMPEFDWRKIAVTAALEHDQRIKVLREIPGGENRELFVDVPDAHFWWVHPQAAIGVDDSGDVQLCARRILRDDRPRLNAIAAAVSAWYSVPRQAVTFPLRRIRLWVAPGRLITSIVGFSVPVPVNAVVTSLTYDFRGLGMVSVQTGWGERDYAPSFL